MPTTLRRTLARAVASVEGQTVGRERIRLVVVVDRDDEAVTDEWRGVLDAADAVVLTGGGAGGGRARQLGAEAGAEPWVAYLDDDDEWLPGKLQQQLEAARAHAADVVSCRAVQVAEDGRVSAPVPSRVYRETERVGDYLFRHRGPSPGRASLFTSTLLVARELATANPWRPELRRHQDWDWLLRAVDGLGARLHQVETVLVRIALGSPGSISAGSDWRSSIRWAEGHASLLSARTRSDFVAGQSLRYALQARSLDGARACLASLRRTGTPPSLRSLALGATGLVPRSLGQQALLRLGANGGTR
ncbi:glycosyltransferase [Cellulosimicrobium sp. NPDC057127]|uniref:glycosyltransferase n=1 Tax=Cellulosimicrobium sp. NPDC057127 TaxID=3346026 RepID=UPI0036257D48